VSRLAVVVLMVFMAVVFAGLLVYYVTTGADWTAYVSAVTGLLSLEISLAALFKQDLFGFRLDIVVADVMLAATDAQYATPTVALPITFINRGYSDGVVESTCVLVREDTGETKAYFPKGEFDMGDFIRANRRIRLDELTTLWRPFPIEAKHSVFKNIFFVQPEGWDLYAPSPWESGLHTFEIHVKAARWKKFRKLAELRFDIPNSDLVGHRMGKGQSAEYRASDLAILDLYTSTKSTSKDS